MHDGEYLDCGNYVSNVFDTNTGIWWHCDDVNFTENSGFPEVVYTRKRELQRKNLKRKIMSGFKDILFVISIRKTI